MKKFNVVLTKEQLAYISRALRVSTLPSYYTEGERLHKELLVLFNEIEPIQEKVWLPFTTLKDGGTYLTRDGREFIVWERKMGGLTYPFGCVGGTYTWTVSGKYTAQNVEDEFDLILELQPY